MREASRKNGSLRNLRNKGPMPRRFPPPWPIEEQAACFTLRDHSGQALAYVYFEDEPSQRRRLRVDAPRQI